MNAQPISVSEIYEHVQYEHDWAYYEENAGCDFIRIKWDVDNIALDNLMTRDFSPLFYKINQEIRRDGIITPDNGPQMSETELFNLHELANSGQAYDESLVLNHKWVEELKRVSGWEMGKEILFEYYKNPCEIGVMRILYNKTVFWRSRIYHKIDKDGYLCSRIVQPAPFTPHGPFQRVVCLYNQELDNDVPYILK